MKKEHWNDAWPTPSWTEYYWHIKTPWFYSQLVEELGKINEWILRIHDSKRNARWQLNAFSPIRVKFRNQEDAVAFRLAFPEFTIRKD